MLIDALCIVCNWYGGIGAAYYGLGGFGVGVGVGAGGGVFGGSGTGGEPGQDDAGVDRTSPDDGVTEARDGLIHERTRLIQNGDWKNQDVRDAWHRDWWGPREDTPYQDSLLHWSEKAQKWAEDMMGGPEIKGTAPAGGQA